MLGGIEADPDQIARRGLIVAEVDTPGSGGRVDAAGQHQEPAGHPPLRRSSLARAGGNPRLLPVIAVLPSFEDEPGIAAQTGAAEACGIGDRGRWLDQAVQHDALEIRRRLHPVRRPFEAWPLRHRAHDIRGDDDDELGLLALKARGAEQRADDRQVAQPGNLLISVLILSWISPAIAKLSPLPRRIVVSARRTVSAGISRSPTRIAPWVESWLTSGRTLIAIRSVDRTVGTKSSRTPNGLNSIVIVEPLPPELFCGDRDRELAAGEETGGLARDRRQVGLREDRDEALLGQRVDDIIDVYAVRVHATPGTLGTAVYSLSAIARLPSRIPATAGVRRVAAFTANVRPVASPNAKEPGFTIASQLKPSCFVMVRWTSATQPAG